MPRGERAPKGFFAFPAGTVRPLTKKRTMSRWPTREVMALHWQPRRRSVAQRLRKRATQTDHQRLAHVKGARQLNVTVMRALGLQWLGEGFQKATGRESRGCPIPQR